MSGAGLAADASGIYFVTGNSDSSGLAYDPPNNVENSLIKASDRLDQILDMFTPYNEARLDTGDQDFGAGGVMLLPPVPGAPAMVAVAGKIGTLYLTSRGALGGYTAGGPDKVLSAVTIGRCWCMPSFFFNGRIPTVVSSGGSQIQLWSVQSTPQVALLPQAKSAPLQTAATGMFTSISSNGTTSPIIWAVTRPISATDTRVWLYAFAPSSDNTTLTQIFVAQAGSWSPANAHSHTVPVVANGLVYVAGESQLMIFGLHP
jgi:iron transport multicopper oxidase